MEVEKVLDEYRNGDEGTRLSLFLAYRDLRDFFLKIEEESPEDISLVRFPWTRSRNVPRAA